MQVRAPENPLLVGVFSSMAGELDKEREALRDLLLPSLGMTPLMAGKAGPRSVGGQNDARVRDAHVCIFLIGALKSSETENEFRRALDLRKPCLVFHRTCSRTPEAEAWLNEVFITFTATPCEPFLEVEDLSTRVGEALLSLLFERFRSYSVMSEAVRDWVLQGHVDAVGPKPRFSRDGSDYPYRPR
jgi:hypothetical protein